MWQDMGIYWAWRGASAPACDPPHAKHLEYEVFPGMSVCCAVVENGTRREVFAAERLRHRGVERRAEKAPESNLSVTAQG
jgi:hypothetical protein